MTGTIKLIWKERVNNSAVYTCLPDRKRIIEQWRSVYGEKFENCAIQIRPDVVEEKKNKFQCEK